MSKPGKQKGKLLGSRKESTEKGGRQMRGQWGENTLYVCMKMS